MKIFKVFSVSWFWERLMLVRWVKKGIILASPSSVSLFLINFKDFAFELSFIISKIWRTVLSPSSAFVRSTVSRVSFITPSITFSYFSGTFKAFIFLFADAWFTGWFEGASLMRHFSFYRTTGTFLLMRGLAVCSLICYLAWVIWWSSLTLTKLWSRILEVAVYPAKDWVSN